MSFWIFAGAITLLVTLLLVRALLSGGRGKEHPATYDLAVYRDQLKEVEKDVTRGIVAEEDAERLRLEISRKILSADAQIETATEGSIKQGPKAAIGITLLLVVLTGGAFYAYWELGQPGYPDMGLKTRFADAEDLREGRPSQAEAESALPTVPLNSGDSDYVKELIQKLRDVVAERPNDAQGLRLLASNEASLGNNKAAYEAQLNLIRVLEDEAQPEDLVAFAEYMILAANGYVSPEAEQALSQVLRFEENHPVARYYMGLMMAQTGRPDVAFRVWRSLLNEGPESAPWIPAIRSQIEELAAWAGVDYELPPVSSLSGPSAEDIAAAGELSAEEQQEMIRGMVAQLSERLATEGGSAEEWSRLISSLGILGDTEQASAIWNEARIVFASDAQGLEVVRAGARRAGVAQ